MSQDFHNSHTAYITSYGGAAAAVEASDPTANRYLQPVVVLLCCSFCDVHRCRSDHLSAGYYTTAGHVAAGVAFAVAFSFKSSA